MHRAYHPNHDTPKRKIRWLAMLPWLAVIYVASGLYSVQPNERAVVRRCGKALKQVKGPGLHFGFPYPIDKTMVE